MSASWQEDVDVISEVCKNNNISVYTERSRSGNGCHLWFFFNEAIEASIARKFGITILDIAMTKSNKIGFDSYDRLFPSQDFLQKDGFGNLIALPLQRYPRKEGNTVFVDDKFIEIDDQWNYLSQINRLDKEFILEFIKHNKSSLKNKGSNLTDTKVHTGKKKIEIVVSDFPDTLNIDLANGLVINKSGISTRGIHLLRSIASYSNPDFFSKQAMRMSTYGTPRVTIMYEEDEEVIMQSMFERDKSVKKLIDNYGMVIVDECHHVSATNFNKILSAARAKYVYGLTATPIRKDGHHPIIFMQCGPIRYKVDAKKEAKNRSFEHYIIPRFTSFRKPVYQDENDWHISDVYKHICENKLRNALIIKDVEESIEDG